MHAFRTKDYLQKSSQKNSFSTSKIGSLEVNRASLNSKCLFMHCWMTMFTTRRYLSLKRKLSKRFLRNLKCKGTRIRPLLTQIRRLTASMMVRTKPLIKAQWYQSKKLRRIIGIVKLVRRQSILCLSKSKWIYLAGLKALIIGKTGRYSLWWM